jgi:hypothetical protein
MVKHFLRFAAVFPACAAVLSAATLGVSSQNCLHLSDSAKGETKRATIKAENAQYGVNLLQEVMKSADLSTVTPTPTVGSYKIQASDLKGKSSYKEKYAVIYDASYTAVTPDTMENYPTPGASAFARPPAGSLLKVGTNHIWFIDFHAIWGSGVGLRRAEATAMATVYAYFANLTVAGIKSGKIVMAGDWNLAPADAGFNALKNINAGKMLVSPAIDTSLTKQGAASQSYDHFVADTAVLTIGSCVLTPLPTGKNDKWWRDNVSDHRGVTCSITY